MRTLIHHSLTRGAKEHPDRIAFRCREHSLTYRELLTRASQLAGQLRANGLKPSDRVGIYMGKQIELPIATYGVLLAGGAYVPIDPNAPQNRIEFIIKDCGIKSLITHPSKQRVVEKLSSSSTSLLDHIIGSQPNKPLQTLSTSWEGLKSKDSSELEEWVNEDDLAYIMYTSGSTGTPKGLMHTHRSGLSYARYSADLYRVSGDDVLGNHAPLHFDISTFEFLTGPYVGATSVLIPEEDIMFAESLAELIEREKLTFWYSVPLALVQLLTRTDLTTRNLDSLRWILFGGEPFPPKYLRQLQALLPKARFCNVYGPAEVNQCSFYHLPELSAAEDEQPIPIGQIWKAAHALVLNSDDSPSAINEVGELLIAAPTMMQGYWARKDLNEIAFYFEHLASGIQRRYYRTGDLVRVDNEGTYHFIGRKDRQIKLRGYRVELDEVEAAFNSQEEVEEAAAYTTISEEDEVKLLQVAVTLHPVHKATSSDILKAARLKLPHYAVPNKISILDSFPRTGSGKIDRTTLAQNHALNLPER